MAQINEHYCVRDGLISQSFHIITTIYDVDFFGRLDKPIKLPLRWCTVRSGQRAHCWEHTKLDLKTFRCTIDGWVSPGYFELPKGLEVEKEIHLGITYKLKPEFQKYARNTVV